MLSLNLFLIHRLLGLTAFALIFIQIISGSLRYKLNLHIKIGRIALLFALLHPLLLVGTDISPYREESNQIYFSLGLIGLFLILLTAGAAILRAKVGPIWRQIHRLNYILFWIIFFHSLNLGLDIQNSFARNVYYLMGIIVILLTIRKIFSYFI